MPLLRSKVNQLVPSVSAVQCTLWLDRLVIASGEVMLLFGDREKLRPTARGDRRMTSVTGTCVLTEESSPTQVKVRMAAESPTARELVSAFTLTGCCSP